MCKKEGHSINIEYVAEISDASVSSWKQYPGYRNSAVEWSGEILAGWQSALWIHANLELHSEDNRNQENICRNKGV